MTFVAVKGTLFCCFSGPLNASQEGDILVARTHKVLPGLGLMVTTPIGVGRVDITDISDCYQKNPFQTLKEGRWVE